MNNLPLDIINTIYEYDNTYYAQLDKCLLEMEFNNQRVHRDHYLNCINKLVTIRWKCSPYHDRPHAFIRYIFCLEDDEYQEWLSTVQM